MVIGNSGLIFLKEAILNIKILGWDLKGTKYYMVNPGSPRLVYDLLVLCYFFHTSNKGP